MDGATLQAAAAWATLLFAPVAYFLRAQHQEIVKLRDRAATAATAADLRQLHDAISELRTTLAAVGTWREGHEKQDDAVHSRLEELLREAVAEIRLNRTEQGEQHGQMRVRLDEAMKEGQAGRRVLHVELGELKAVVQELVGAERARQGKRGAGC